MLADFTSGSPKVIREVLDFTPTQSTDTDKCCGRTVQGKVPSHPIFRGTVVAGQRHYLESTQQRRRHAADTRRQHNTRWPPPLIPLAFTDAPTLPALQGLQKKKNSDLVTRGNARDIIDGVPTIRYHVVRPAVASVLGDEK